MKILDSKRFDDNNDLVETWVEKRDDNFVFSQLSGGIIKYSHDRVKLTEDEFFGLFPKVWAVECKGYGLDYFGLFHGRESAMVKLCEIIEQEIGHSDYRLEYSTHLDFVASTSTDCVTYTHSQYLFTAYEMMVK